MTQRVTGPSADQLEQESQIVASAVAVLAQRRVVINVGGKAISNDAFADNGASIAFSLDPESVSGIRNTEHALKVWRGLALSEAAHVLSPAAEQYGMIGTDPSRHVFYMLETEQCIRQAVARDATWGPALQAFGAFSFPTQYMRAGTIDLGTQFGGKTVEAPVVGTVEGTAEYARRFNVFAYHLRRGLPLVSAADEVVAARALVPENLKDLSKGDVLGLARRIHDALSTGIDVSAEEAAAAAEAQHVAAESSALGDARPGAHPAGIEPLAPSLRDPQPEEEPELDESEERIPFNPVKLFANKWAAGLFAASVAATSWFLLQFGVQLWVVLSVVALCAAGAGGFTLFVFRASVGSGLGNFLDRLRAGIQSLDKSPTFKIVALTVVGLLLVGLVYMLLTHVPLPYIGFVLSAIASLCVMIQSSRRDQRLSDAEEAKQSRIFGLVMAGSAVMMGASLFSALAFMGFFGVLIAGGVFFMMAALAVAFMVPVGSGNSRARNNPFMRIPYAIAALFYGFLDSIASGFGHFLEFLKVAAGVIGAVFVICAQLAVFVFQAVRAAYFVVEPFLISAWHTNIGRLVMLGMAAAVPVTMIVSVIMAAGQMSWWLGGFYAIMIGGFVFAGWYFRNQIWTFVATQEFLPIPEMDGHADDVPLDMVTETWEPIVDVRQVEPNQAVLDEDMGEVRALAERLRPLLENLGERMVDKIDQADGHEIGDDPHLIETGDMNVYVDEQVRPMPSIHVGLAVDCSYSVKGEKFRRERVLALAIEEATIGLSHISVGTTGFVDTVIFDCTPAGQRRASGLVADGGNNDTAGLAHVREAAHLSGKEIKILCMLSDVQPAEASYRSLSNLALQYQQEGDIIVQFTSAQTKAPPFGQIVIDIFGQPLDEAIVAFGHYVQALAQERA